MEKVPFSCLLQKFYKLKSRYDDKVGKEKEGMDKDRTIDRYINREKDREKGRKKI